MKTPILQAHDWFDDFHPFDGKLDSFHEFLQDEFPHLVTWETIGESWEGRNITAVQFTGLNGGHDKPQVYFDGMIHAREWNAVSTPMYVAHYLLSNYGHDDRVTALMDRVEFLFFPVVNPDGYQYSHTTNRMWRKNRRDNGDGSFGVDCNRNFDDHWGLTGCSSNPSSESYWGPSAESEPEVQAVSNYWRRQRHIVAGVSYHCCGELLNRPTGYMYDPAVGEDLMAEAGRRMADAIRAVNGRSYTSQQSIYLYQTSGTAKDWYNSDNLFDDVGYRAYGYIIELPGQFVQPADGIIPIGEENVAAMLELAEYAADHPIEG